MSQAGLSMMERVRSRTSLGTPTPAHRPNPTTEEGAPADPLALLSRTAGALAAGRDGLGDSPGVAPVPLDDAWGPPPLDGRMRPRSDTAESRDEMYRKRQRMLYAREQCEAQELSSSARKDIMEAAQLSPPRMMIKAMTMLAAEGDRRRADDDLALEKEKKMFMEGGFSKYILPRLQAMVADSRTIVYVKGLLAAVLENMSKNPTAWQIPLSLRSIVYESEFKGRVSRSLTNARATAKLKVMKAYKNRDDIGTLVRNIMPDNTEITEEMLERWAWMQFQIVDYKGPDDDFWPKLDILLAERRKEAATKPEAERDSWFREEFKGALELHIEMFGKSKTKCVSRTALPDWQLAVRRSIGDINRALVATDGVSGGQPEASGQPAQVEGEEEDAPALASSTSMS